MSRRTSGGGLLAAGCHALRTLVEFGAVLTPETLDIPRNPAAEPKAPVREKFPQERVCFTLMTRDELYAGSAGRRSHADRFGPFAIGLHPIRARALGVVPVMYFYGGGRAINVSFEMLYRLREMRTLLGALARIENRSERPGRELPDGLELDDLGLAETDHEPLEPRIAALSPDQARAIAGLFDTERVPAWNLVEWIDIILNFFQTADSKMEADALDYFHQREWRIVRLFGAHAQCHTLSLTHDIDRADCYPLELRRKLRGRLAELDRNYFSKTKLDRSFVLVGTSTLPFFHFVDEVVVPRAAAETAEDLLNRESPNGWQCAFETNGRPLAVFSRAQHRRVSS